MAKNVLFNFIDICHQQTIDQFTLKTNEQNHRYFLIPLPLKSCDELLPDYTVAEHHLSVYETMSEKIAVFSQYHYTATLKGTEGSVYRLHVNFKSSDTIIGQPMMTDSNGQKIDKAEWYEAFNKVAQEQSLPVIAQLKKQLVEHLQDLLKKFDEQDVKTSKLFNDKTKRKEYKQGLQELVLLLEKINWLTNDNHYAHTAKLTNSMLASINKEALAQEPQKLNSSPTHKKDAPHTKGKVAHVKDKKHYQHKKACLAQDLETLTRKCNSLKKRAHSQGAADVCKKNLNDLLALHSSLDILLLTYDGNVAASLLINLRSTQKKIHHLSQQFLTALLANKKYKNARQLTPFHPHLSYEHHLTNAITEHDYALFKLLLDHCGMELSLPITVNNCAYSSIRNYLIQQGKESFLTKYLIDNMPMLDIADKDSIKKACNFASQVKLDSPLQQEIAQKIVNSTIESLYSFLPSTKNLPKQQKKVMNKVFNETFTGILQHPFLQPNNLGHDDGIPQVTSFEEQEVSKAQELDVHGFFKSQSSVFDTQKIKEDDPECGLQ